MRVIYLHQATHTFCDTNKFFVFNVNFKSVTQICSAKFNDHFSSIQVKKLQCLSANINSELLNSNVLSLTLPQSMSSFGRLFRITTYGESHCKSVGVIIDGCPPRMQLNESDIQPQLTRRRPGQSKITTPRNEADLVTIQSGTENGITLGTPIALTVQNLNVKPKDYKEMSVVPRPGHADYTYQIKYGIRASSGGGRASARETIGRVAAGAVAEKYLIENFNTQIVSFVTSVGNITVPDNMLKHSSGRSWTREEIDRNGQIRLIRGADKGWVKKDSLEEQAVCDELDDTQFIKITDTEDLIPAYMDYLNQIYSRNGRRITNISLEEIQAYISDDIVLTRCPCISTACKFVTLIREVKHDKDSIGGTAACFATNVPIGLGEPVFDKLEAKLAQAMLSLPATKGFEIGSGFEGTKLRGSCHNDAFLPSKNSTQSKPLLSISENKAGGTLGGISSGADIYFKVAIKPVSTIGKAQKTVDFMGNATVLAAKGRHDPCVLPRVPPLLESMTALVFIDATLIQISRAYSSAENNAVKTVSPQVNIFNDPNNLNTTS